MTRNPQQIVDAFNAQYPIGTLVRYWRGTRTGHPSGTGRTHAKATLLGGHTPVAWIEGARGAIGLTHVEAVVSEKGQSL